MVENRLQAKLGEIVGPNKIGLRMTDGKEHPPEVQAWLDDCSAKVNQALREQGFAIEDDPGIRLDA